MYLQTDAKLAFPWRCVRGKGVQESGVLPTKFICISMDRCHFNNTCKVIYYLQSSTGSKTLKTDNPKGYPEIDRKLLDFLFCFTFSISKSFTVSWQWNMCLWLMTTFYDFARRLGPCPSQKTLHAYLNISFISLQVGAMVSILYDFMYVLQLRANSSEKSMDPTHTQALE